MLNNHYQFNTKYRKKEVCRHLNRYVNNCAGNFQKESGSSRTADRAATATTAVTKADVKELSDLNSATGTTFTLTKGMICRADFKNGGKVDAAACAQLCKKRKDCSEFSVGGWGHGCRYAYSKGGCCNKWNKRSRNGWNNAGWKANACTPFRKWSAAMCSMGGCKFYAKKVITTKATRWPQWGPAKRRCTKKR